MSAFGGVIGVNRPIDGAAAEEMAKLFVEVIAAPAIRRSGASEIRGEEEPAPGGGRAGDEKWVLKHVSGGMLVQDADIASARRGRPESRHASAQPTDEEMRALLFAWKVCKHVKSNAILYARDGQTVGVGAGQMSRVDSPRSAR